MTDLNMSDIVKQAQGIQNKMKWAQAEIASLEAEGVAGGGLVRIVMNGRYEVKKVDLADEVLAESKEVLQDLIAAAINSVVGKVALFYQDQMMKMTKDLGIPPDLDLNRLAKDVARQDEDAKK